MTDITPVLPIIAIVIALLGIVWQYFGGILTLRKEMGDSEVKNVEQHSRLDHDIRELIASQNNRIVAAETKMELFWNAAGSVVSSLIKQPIHFEKDELMDKLMGGPINKDELCRLKHILHTEVKELKETKQTQSLAYALALAYIEQKLFDYNFAERLQGVAE
jgi:hypothetical protein